MLSINQKRKCAAILYSGRLFNTGCGTEVLIQRVGRTSIFSAENETSTMYTAVSNEVRVT